MELALEENESIEILYAGRRYTLKATLDCEGKPYLDME